MRLLAILLGGLLFASCTGAVSPDAEADRGLDLARQGRLTEAVEAFRMALAADPGHPEKKEKT